MDLKRLEFNMITQVIQGEQYKEFDEYSISIADSGVIVKLNNKDITINLDKIIVYKATKLGGMIYKFQIKSEYTDFDNSDFIQESYLYKRLFGYSMNPNIKRLLVFLGSLSKNEIPKYVELLDPDTKKSIEKFFSTDL